MAEPNWKNRTPWTGDSLPLWLIAPTKRGKRLFAARR